MILLMEGMFRLFVHYSLGAAALAVLLVTLAVYVVALIRRNNGVLDIAFGPMLLSGVAGVLWYWGTVDLRQVIIMTLLTVWALRLALHVMLRNWGRPEDWRHVRTRLHWGQSAWFRSFFSVFLVRGALALIVAFPALWIVSFSDSSLTWFDLIGGLVWLSGFLIEMIADAQLIRFRKDPANHGIVMGQGLWHFSRHPNYFGEVLMWWGIWLFAVSVSGGWISIIGPMAVTLWILKVAIPSLEGKQMSLPAYREYAARTGPLIPKLK